MSDVQLFRIHSDGQAREIAGSAAPLEKPLQQLMEANLQTLLGIRFLATEFSTGKVHGGRIDTLGLDENNSPVIIEYKRSVGENVINQGLYYLDWLMDHQADFKWLVMEKLGADVAAAIDWSTPRLLCVAADFTKYDRHAVQQIQRHIELLRYRRFGDDLLLLELAYANNGTLEKRTPKLTETVALTDSSATTHAPTPKPQGPDKSFAEIKASLPEALLQTLAALEDLAQSFGDDVQCKELRLYTAFKTLRNFASVVLQRSRLLVYLHLDAAIYTAQIQHHIAATRDVSAIGHWGTGDIEVSITQLAELQALEPYLRMAYEA
ncbi:DUF5655 domain-containing protein [Comamonas sp.]|uniref:DUF5655 domain-containing protein n=1 Tax=Comamonas sp. TaxID=34028 RepID=UPI00289C80E7|nr:DUF5655 domain-containing protein [Comamonas sp.]